MFIDRGRTPHPIAVRTGGLRIDVSHLNCWSARPNCDEFDRLRAINIPPKRGEQRDVHRRNFLLSFIA